MDKFALDKITILRNIIGFVGGLILFFGFVIAQHNNALGSIEGKFFPVATATAFHLAQSNDVVYEVPGAKLTAMSGVMNKFRECTFIKMEAIVSDPAGHETISEVFYLEDDKIRHVGVHKWGPWLIRVPFKNVANNNHLIHLIAYHQCHPFWQTITHFR